MDAQAIIQWMATVVFPSTMCGAMGGFVVDQTNKHREEVSKLNEQHEKEMNTVVDALNNNTVALRELSVKLGGN